MTVDPDHDALQDALRQIALVEQHLLALGDRPSLSRFGEADAGLSIAASLGHTLLTTAEARTVDQLSRMPAGVKLVRSDLAISGVPRVAEVDRLPKQRQSVPVTPVLQHLTAVRPQPTHRSEESR